jgi:hypothetical protein
MSSQIDCTATGCTGTSRAGLCWRHRPAPLVRCENGRIIIGGHPGAPTTVLSRAAALDLAHRLADALTDSPR